MSSWLTEDLKQKTRKVFEPRYKRKLTDKEVLEIAENLEAVVEALMKLKCKEKNEYVLSKS